MGQTEWRTLVESICAERGLSVVLSWDMPQGYETANGTFDPVAKTLFLNPAVLQSAPEYEAMFYLVHPTWCSMMERASACAAKPGRSAAWKAEKRGFATLIWAFLTRWTPMNSRRSG